MDGVLFDCFFLVIASGINYWKRRGENKANQVRYFIIVQILNIHEWQESLADALV